MGTLRSRGTRQASTQLGGRPTARSTAPFRPGRPISPVPRRYTHGIPRRPNSDSSLCVQLSAQLPCPNLLTPSSHRSLRTCCATPPSSTPTGQNRWPLTSGIASLEVMDDPCCSEWRTAASVPSRKLMDHVATAIESRSPWILLDEQLVVFEQIRSTVKSGIFGRRKQVVIVRGGPGTGKSVLAINLMADLLREGRNAHYATGSRAFTETLWDISVAVRGRRSSTLTATAEPSSMISTS